MNLRRIENRRCLLLLLAIAWGVAPLPAEEVRTWGVTELLSSARSRDVIANSSGDAIQLETGVLISDDGPAAGYSYRPNEEVLEGSVRARKSLIVDDPRARQAVLLFAPGGELRVQINGQAAELTPHGRAGQYWQQFLIDPALLQTGNNVFEFSGQGKLWIARDDEFAGGAPADAQPPNRSSRSLNGGQTWSDTALGKAGDIDGEYCVRLFLDQFLPSGWLELPVIDVGNLAGTGIAPSAVSLEAVSYAVRGDCPPGTSLSIRMRSGTMFRVDRQHWSDWKTLPGWTGKLASLHGRFVQFAVDLATDDRRVSPQLQAVTVRNGAHAASAGKPPIVIREPSAASLVRTSIPFAYEPLDHPRLKALRESHQLDQVIQGANSEWEQICRLATWSAQRWQGLGHLKDRYPAWDALEILSPHADGTPVGGFCQQANIVFLQACESLGIHGRAVSIGPGSFGDRIRGGHETVEIWSNEYAKWVYIDGNTAWYAVDQATETPLSLRELRTRQLQTLREEPVAATRIVVLAETRHTWKDLASWPPFVELRMIPRSNFLERREPLPLNQGMRGWFWTGHHVWNDAKAPAALLYSQRESLPANWDWQLNTVACRWRSLDEPGRVQVDLDTETPDWAAYELDRNGDKSDLSRHDFSWQLKPGQNRLAIRTRNTRGRPGPMATWKLEYTP